MTIPYLILSAHELLCLALFWSVFCRSAITHGHRTKLSIRVSLLVLGAAALAAMVAPFYGWQPDGVTLLMLLAYVAMQVTTAELWRDGTPEPFQRSAP